MIDWIVTRIPQWDSYLALALYWIPVVVCLVGYAILSVRMYYKDVEARATAISNREKQRQDAANGVTGTRYYSTFYLPKLTVGWLVGHALISFIPVLNIWMSLFDVLPRVASNVVRTLGRVLNIPFVPPLD